MAGPALNMSIYVCEVTTRFPRSSGIFFGDNPLKYALPVIVLQISLVGMLTTILQLLLTPLGETSFFPHLLVISYYIIFHQILIIIIIKFQFSFGIARV